MKNWAALIFATFLFFTSLTNSQTYPHITELRGLEDSLSQTHLFYRLVENYGCWSKNIYHYDVNTNSDTIFITDFGYEVYPGWGCEGDYVNDYEFFESDFSKFIYCGYNLWIDPVALLRRYDGDVHVEAFVLTELEISQQDENLVYVSAGPGFFKSTDGGYNFVRYDSMQFIDESIISLSKNNDHQIYGIDDNKLVRSEDDGNSYFIVDNSVWDNNSELYYDSDGNHIYGVSIKRNFLTQNYDASIYVSDNNGNPFTWNKVVNHTIPITFTNDEVISGEIYYSFQKNIFKSIDHGSSFNLFKTLDANITELYKKSGTDILYASTPLRIYEITADTMQVIKSLPIPEEVFDWYPLNLNDKWIYYNTFYGDLGDSSNWISIAEVEENLIIENNVYSKLFVKNIPLDTLISHTDEYQYLRVDSASGLIYRAWVENDTVSYEELIMDLLAEVGDTIPVGNGIYLESEQTVSQFGVDTRKRTFLHVLTPAQQIELVKGFGITYDWVWELVENKSVIKGCIIDGVVYGDTTVVSVDEEITQQPTQFSLSQNYPNPFNPSTKIKFTIPQDVRSERQDVSLKVYDVLGNKIATLVNEELSAGEYEVEFNEYSIKHQPSSGIYFYQLKAGSFIQTKKMILLK